MTMTKAYERPSSAEYEAAALEIDRKIELLGEPKSVFDDIVIEAMRRRARMFRELAAKQKARGE